MSLFNRKPKPPAVHPIPPGEEHLLPRNPDTGQVLPPREQPGYYPGFRIMSQQKFWEPATRNLVRDRVDNPPPIRFFSADQAKFWRAVHDHLVPQFDRIPETRIDILAPLDERLYQDRTDGYRYETMPQDREVYQTLGIQAINAEANACFGGDFLFLPFLQQDQVLKNIHDTKIQSAKSGSSVWKRLDMRRFWQLILQDAIEGYYAHPFAWDEIGFGGPAYPRAYTRLERGEPEPWEVEEARYTWTHPPSSVSGEVDLSTTDEHQSHEGSGGTH